MAGRKGRSGRPRENKVLVRVKLSLDRFEDADLIAFFESVPKGMRPHAVKEALRGGIDRGRAVASSSEDGGSADLLDDMLGAWTSEQ